MRKLLTILAITSITWLTAALVLDKVPVDMLQFPKGKEYKTEWAAVDSTLGLNQPKTALPIIEKIYADATKTKDYGQMVKAVFYLNGLKTEYNYEDSQLEFIKAIEAEVADAPFPAKQVMLSGLADAYWSYYERNRWKIQQRTETMDVDAADPATWDAAKFAEKASALYLQSLQPTDSLKRTPVEVFDPVILQGRRRDLRPTLYDLLAHKAVDFFKNTEAGLTQPADKFYMESPRLLGPSEKFVTTPLQHPDSSNFRLIALQILQDLTTHNTDSRNLGGLVHVELERLAYVKEQSILSQAEKDSLYSETLTTLLKRYASDSSSSLVGYTLAQHYSELGNAYGTNDAKYRWKLKEALAICKQAITKYPNTEGALLCGNLVRIIEKPTIVLQTEQVLTPEMPALVSVDAKNVGKLYLRLVKVPAGIENDINNGYSETWVADPAARPVFRAWQQTIPNPGDYQKHGYEIAIEGLPLGKYYLLASNDSTFDIATLVSYGSFQVSNLSYVARNLNNGGMDVLVLDRNSGLPVKSAGFTWYESYYDYNKRENVFTKGRSLKTTNEGRMLVDGRDKYRHIELELSYKGDTLTSINSHYLYGKNKPNEPKWDTRVSFFLDRAIYRPGQTVHFKALVFENKGTESRILQNEKIEVIMRDRNYQEIGKMTLKTNDYGTVNGSFVLPSSNITGNVTIYTSHGSKYFKVEEYKRPKFEVTFEPIAGTFKVDDSVTVKGTAKAYAGSNIDGAQVRYRVVREVQYPIWGWYRGYFPSSPSMEIASGTTTTDSVGGYTINFTAIPDRSIAKESDPIFSYRVYADVTDISGETHSSETVVRVGYKALEIAVNLPDAINKAKQDSISLYANNLNGQPEPTQVQLSIHQLKAPTHPLRTRQWELPDTNLIPESDFRKQFPLDAYGDEMRYENWAKGAEVFKTSMNTSTQTKFLPSIANWAPGVYSVELTAKDRFGQEVKSLQYVTVYGTKDKNIPVPQHLWSKLLTPTVEPGKNLSFLIGTAAKDVRVLYEVVQGDKIIKQEWLKLSKEQKLVEFPITEANRGGLQVRFITVRDGRRYGDNFNVMVPYPSKDLSLSFESFRDKLTPGAEEQWKITVKGPKGEKVAAELLASMYDASLDAFVKHNWSFTLPGRGQRYGSLNNWNGFTFGKINFNTHQKIANDDTWFDYDQPRYDELRLYGPTDFVYSFRNRTGVYSISYDSSLEDVVVESEDITTVVGGKYTGGDGRRNYKKSDAIGYLDDAMEEVPGVQMQKEAETGGIPARYGENSGSDPEITPRKNLQETAFFYPAVETDAEGNFVLKFTVPEALTRWKFQGFAHTQALDYGLISKETVTQKELMVFPNAPRFLREGDTIVFSAKVSNLSEIALNGTAKLQLFDAFTMQPIDAQFKLSGASQPITMGKGQSAVAKWTLIVPEGISAVVYRVSAQAGNYTDGEENALPILSNRMLVTETLPINLSGTETKKLTFDKLLNSGKSKTLRHQSLTLELTANPAWYAIQALPYLMEYPYECNEQTFNRYYANSIAAHIANSNPQIQKVFEQWKNTDALVSNLEKNQELKNIILEETPWLLQAQNETERKKRIGLLFELNNLARQQDNSLRKLVQAQSPNGGWPWFKGGPDNRYITQYIVTGIGRLVKMGVIDLSKEAQLNKALLNGIRYLDDRIKEDYDELVKNKAKLDDRQLYSTQLNYLYARSFFSFPVAEKSKEAYEFYLGQTKKHWNKLGTYELGLAAIVLNRLKSDKTDKTVGLIMTSLKQTAINHEELGMYWKSIRAGYGWYEAPIESQALLIEAFVETGNDTAAVDAMRTWLLKQKQVQDWGNTKATADACYALLLEGTDWLSETPKLTVKLGDKTIDGNANAEPGTGYSKTTISGSEVTASMGNITATREGKGISWGALYWQYFEQLDKITPAQTPLSIVKKLYVQRDSKTGPVLEPVTETTELKPGDLLTVRIELRVDRDMEFVHLKDMRAAGLEPINVLSSYKWKGGLGYYESTRDAATNFFFDRLPRGTHVFEYPLRVNLSGSYSNGISTLQCMYAPEFSAHSEGVRITVR